MGKFFIVATVLGGNYAIYIINDSIVSINLTNYKYRHKMLL